ncbi:UDP-glucose flavonoid 3-O-glucosyltransferase 6 [Vitis vinifera]|uniref:UDP-glucose flavonoid 3-O-glucosyltransferase 6 n=1 Tax=Vitis vinifera TaxID=29760 RepID=A0A438J0Q0_VITVI|nr:UDP-glucose flavonoid 3-O-glucosyltransferase 6 [Vitis vinifera]
MKQTELVFIPVPIISHLSPTVEIAKLLTQRDPRFSITIFIMKFPFGSIDSMTTDSDSIRFVTLPPVEISSGATTPGPSISEFIKVQTLSSETQSTSSLAPTRFGSLGKVFPPNDFDKGVDGAAGHMYHMRRLRQAKGVLVNTFIELESHAIQSFSGSTLPPVYPVGPHSHTRTGFGEDQQNASDIMSWLDDQPPSSVVFPMLRGMEALVRIRSRR